MSGIDALKPLSGGAIDTLLCLFLHGPTWDGNVPSKAGRDDLYERGLIDRADGWQWLTRDGIMAALGRGYGQEKEVWQQKRRR